MASVMIPILIGITHNRRRIFYVKILVASLLVSAIANVINETLIFKFHLNGSLVYHCYTLIELFFLTLLYKHFFNNVKIKHAINIVVVLFFIFKIFDLIFFSSILEPDALAMTIEAIIMIILGIIYFDQVLREMKIPNLEKHPMFWINSGILIYFSGSLFLFLFGPFIFSNKSFYQNFWSIHSMLIMAKHILFAVGLWLQK